MKEGHVIFGAWLKTYRPTKPVILAAEGFARAGGTEILQGTDIRVAGESAKFGVTEVQRGLFPMAGSTVRLPRQIPYTIALEMLLTGADYTAAQCKEFGLIGHVVPDGQALAKAKEIAQFTSWGAFGPGLMSMPREIRLAPASALGVSASHTDASAAAWAPTPSARTTAT